MHLSVTSQCKVLSSEEVIHVNGVSMRLRILDVPGFTDSCILTKSDERNLEIFRLIVRVQEEIVMKFRRIVYFLPCRGPLEKVSKELHDELKAMHHFFGKSIFEGMVLAGTNPSSPRFQRLGIEFDPEDIESSRVVFQVAMRMATGDETLCCPPLVYIGLSQYPGSRIFSDILSAPVQSDEGLRLKFMRQEISVNADGATKDAITL